MNEPAPISDLHNLMISTSYASSATQGALTRPKEGPTCELLQTWDSGHYRHSTFFTS